MQTDGRQAGIRLVEQRAPNLHTHTQLLVRSLRVNFADVNHGLLNVRKRQKRAFLQGRCLESCGRPKLPDAITIDGRL